MTLVLTGLSHKTAPVEVRERLAFSKETLTEKPRLDALFEARLVLFELEIFDCPAVGVERDVVAGDCLGAALFGDERAEHALVARVRGTGSRS
jgi:hypothetical protein